ncbi:MAG: antibiotic biosynthesis monooxygenase family protein [Ktedonobacteraceae bacterium]
MQTVILINPFEVPAGQEEEFLTQWREAAEHLRQAPGFISTRLHECALSERFAGLPQRYASGKGMAQSDGRGEKLNYTIGKLKLPLQKVLLFAGLAYNGFKTVEQDKKRLTERRLNGKPGTACHPQTGRGGLEPVAGRAS